jgi:FkbM family methyltransferase
MDVAPPDLRNEDNVNRIIAALPDNQPGIALDIGANFGKYTDLLVSKFEHVYAFECDPENMKVLKEKVKHKNVTFIPQAVGIEDNTMIKLYRSNDPGGSSTNEESPRFGGWGHSWDNFVWVPTMKLDTFWNQHGGHPPWEQTRFIKCDIEGAENYVFDHAQMLFQNNKLTMVLECHQPVDFNRLYNLFDNYGYKVYDVDWNRVTNLRRDCHFIISNEKKAWDVI